MTGDVAGNSWIISTQYALLQTTPLPPKKKKKNNKKTSHLLLDEYTVMFWSQTKLKGRYIH